MADVNLTLGIKGDNSDAVEKINESKKALEGLNSVQVGKETQKSIQDTGKTIKDMGAASLNTLNQLTPLDGGLKSVASVALGSADAIEKLAATGFSPLGIAITAVSLALPLIISLFDKGQKSAKELLTTLSDVSGMKKANEEFVAMAKNIRDISKANLEVQKVVGDVNKLTDLNTQNQKKLNAEFAKTVQKNPAKAFEDIDEAFAKQIKNVVKLTDQYKDAQSDLNSWDLIAAQAARNTLPALNKAFELLDKNADISVSLQKNADSINALAATGKSARQIIADIFKGADFSKTPQLYQNLQTTIEGINAQSKTKIISKEVETQDKLAAAREAYAKREDDLITFRQEQYLMRLAEKENSELAFYSEVASLYEQVPTEPPGFFSTMNNQLDQLMPKMTAAGETANAAFAVMQGGATGLADAFTQLGASGKLSLGSVVKGMQMALAAEAKAIAGRAFLNAIYETGKGLAALATGNPMAGTHFAAAGKFAAVGALAGTLGGVVGGGGATGGGGGGGGGGGAPAPQEPGTVVNQTVEIRGTYDNRSLEQTERFLKNLDEDLQGKI